MYHPLDPASPATTVRMWPNPLDGKAYLLVTGLSVSASLLGSTTGAFANDVALVNGFFLVLGCPKLDKVQTSVDEQSTYQDTRQSRR